MNKHEISIHVNNNSRLQIVQPEFTSIIKFRNIHRKTPVSLLNKVEGLQMLRTPILKTSANGCLVHNMSLKT